MTGQRATVGLCILLGFLARWWALSTGEPIGTDGYYYVVQIEDLVATGLPHVPDASWTLRFLAVPHALGLDPIAALALGGALLATLPAVVALLLGDRGLRLALLLAASPTLTHLAADFPKSLGLAAPWLLLALALDHAATDRRWLVPATLGFLLAATAHRLGAILAVLAVLGAGIAWAAQRRGPEGARRIGLAIAAAVVLGEAVLVVASWAPGLLHVDDLERLGLSATLRFPPWSWWSARPDTSWPQAVELVLPWLALLLVPLAARRHPVLAGACSLPLLLALAPVYPADVLDLGYRVHLFAPLLSLPLLATVLPVPSPRGLLVGALLLPGAVYGPVPSTTPPYESYRQVLDRIPEPLPELLVAHQGMNFLYDHLTGHEAMAWAPDPGLPLDGVRRVAWGIQPGEWLAVWGEGDPEVVPLGQGYHLVGERTWLRLVDSASGDAELDGRVRDWRNPLRSRPAYLMRRRRPATEREPAGR